MPRSDHQRWFRISSSRRTAHLRSWVNCSIFEKIFVRPSIPLHKFELRQAPLAADLVDSRTERQVLRPQFSVPTAWLGLLLQITEIFFDVSRRELGRLDAAEPRVRMDLSFTPRRRLATRPRFTPVLLEPERLK